MQLVPKFLVIRQISKRSWSKREFQEVHLIRSTISAEDRFRPSFLVNLHILLAKVRAGNTIKCDYYQILSFDVSFFLLLINKTVASEVKRITRKMSRLRVFAWPTLFAVVKIDCYQPITLEITPNRILLRWMAREHARSHTHTHSNKLDKLMQIVWSIWTNVPFSKIARQLNLYGIHGIFRDSKFDARFHGCSHSYSDVITI